MRCLLKGKLIKAGTDQFGPARQDSASPHDVVPPTQHTIGNFSPCGEDTSSPVSILSEHAGSRDEGFCLLAPLSCSMGSVSSMFLAHFVAETSGYMTTVSSEKNPFLE